MVEGRGDLGAGGSRELVEQEVERPRRTGRARPFVAAKPARKGTNPFTGEPTPFKAKPATVKVKVRPMKKLKDAAKA